MAQGSGSYYDDYMRSNALLKHCNEKNTKKLLTDRNAYISFLEVQLERVSAACLSTQTFEKRLVELESSQMSNDQKLGSLSKVFRLNQEYVEQTSQQAQSELAGHAAKVETWMEKLSAELERQQPRMVTLEEQFQQCQEYLPFLAETNDAVLGDVKHQFQQEIEELKAHVFALEARIDEVHSSQAATERKVENLTDTTTLTLDQELALVRSSVSEKSFQLERTVAQLGKELEQLVHQIDASWRAEASENAGRYETHCGELQQRLSQLQQELEHGHTEVKDVLKKCLDTQHLLSGTVVALQFEVDEVKKGLRASTKTTGPCRITLKNALQLLQACALEAQQASEDRSSKLADRVATAEDLMETRTDDLRRRMLAALDEIGDDLHQDAGATKENTAARKDTESQFKRIMDFSSTLENRLRILEHTVLSLETKLQRTRAISKALGRIGANKLSSSEITTDLNNLPSDRDASGEAQERLNSEQFYQKRKRELEERLHRRAQFEEEQRILFPEHGNSSKSPMASSGYVSSFATEDEPRRARSTLKKKTIKRSSKTAQLGDTSKALKPNRLHAALRK
ncbi:hypothetical protein GN244_ATG15792 [Phytophthora infestans]|uniref:Uncharacterized protein n=1 Tax=Phytophthora infestans TaxID=4787 RepID=A0A833VX19_PHYIN|nr:hypothetical protein GN244_ATG15792 [Phytophthora infestans]